MTQRYVGQLLAAAIVTFTSLAAHAGQGPNVALGGKIYSHYGVDITEGHDKANEFAITRVYLTVRATLSDALSTRVTTDVGRLKSQHDHEASPLGEGEDVQVVPTDGNDTKLVTFIKYAYLQWKTPVDGVKLQLGAAPTGWTGLYDKFWGRRWVSKSFADQAKLLSTSDLGVHATGVHMDGFVQWHGGVINGAGYSKPEGDVAKTAQLRMTVDPLAGGDSQLPVSAFVSHDLGADGDPVTVVAGGLGYKSSLGLAWFEFLHRGVGDQAGQGLSVSLVPHVSDIASLLVRLDQWDPDTEAEADATTRIVAGVTKDFAKRVSAGVLYERSEGEGATEPEHGVFVRMQAGF